MALRSSFNSLTPTRGRPDNFDLIMKQKSVFLAENTNSEVESFLKTHHTIYLPVGAMEQHGPHSPVGTDVYIPQEIARRVCVQLGTALVAPPLTYTLSYPHRGFTSEFSLSIETFMAVVRDLALSFGKAGFKRIVFLNGHYDNTYALAYACAQAAERMPAGAKAFPFNYWDGMTSAQFGAMSEAGKGMHAGEGEVSMLLALNPNLVDMELANAEFPKFPETKGEQLLQAGVDSVINLMKDIEKTFDELTIR